MIQIKDLLKRKGMTAKELAVKIGISEGALSKSLSGNPTLARLEEIAAALGISVPELSSAPKEGTIICPHCGKPIQFAAPEKQKDEQEK